MIAGVTGARVIDPTGRGTDDATVELASSTAGAPMLDASGLIAIPGLIDIGTRLRNPGASRACTVASECRAALSAGITTIACAPDLEPPLDDATRVRSIREESAASGARTWPIAALTRGLEGRQLAELAALKSAGCVAAGQGDLALDDTRVLLRAMEYAATFDLPLVLTPLDRHLAGRGCAHAGEMATRLGLSGVPIAAETVALSRLLELVASVGCRVHLARLSSARSVELLRHALDDGLPVSASVGIHHLYFTDMELAGFDTDFHSVVPFRARQDRAALREAVREGVIGSICSDHAPLDPEARLAPFPASAPGLSACDAFLPLLFALPEVLDLPLRDVIARVTVGPSAALSLDFPTLTPTRSRKASSVSPPSPSAAPTRTDQPRWRDLVLVDPEGFDGFDDRTMLSRGPNSPLKGHRSLEPVTGEPVALRACAVKTFVDGRSHFDREQLSRTSPSRADPRPLRD